ncbi:MAG: hypothetical protein J7K82_05920 [Thermoproteales archaeon]|nr:hypothetical protein [Thermoproteales archaeon]
MSFRVFDKESPIIYFSAEAWKGYTGAFSRLRKNSLANISGVIIARDIMGWKSSSLSFLSHG